MALNLKVNIQTANDCRNLVIEDITGNYSENNLGGWGGLNINPLKTNVNMSMTLQAYLYEGENLTIAEGNFDFTVFENFIDTPSQESYANFKMSIPVETLAVEIAELESFNIVEDNLYQIILRVGDSSTSTEYAIKEFVFKNTCSITKLVAQALTSINLQCEDCDDSDIEKALLAKSLLESIENV